MIEPSVYSRVYKFCCSAVNSIFTFFFFLTQKVSWKRTEPPLDLTETFDVKYIVYIGVLWGFPSCVHIRARFPNFVAAGAESSATRTRVDWRANTCPALHGLRTRLRTSTYKRDDDDNDDGSRCVPRRERHRGPLEKVRISRLACIHTMPCMRYIAMTFLAEYKINNISCK